VFAALLLCVTLVITSSDTSSPSGVRALSKEETNFPQQKSMHLIYGTAWKKDETARLVQEAITSGFRHIDTACQPKHYNEKGVGDGWTAAAKELGLTRRDISLQTKFTPVSGQDPNTIPYDKHQPISEQARQSLEVSLRNLQTDYLDSWVLHSPPGSFEDLMDVWRVMEEAVTQQKVLKIGISNCYDMDTFRLLYQQAKRKPSFLQNRFHARTKFDTPLRHFCKEHDVQYQSFWTLTANREALALPIVGDLAEAKGLTPQTYMFAFLMSLGYITPLSGTTSSVHMKEDVAVMERMKDVGFTFTPHEQQRMAEILKMPKL